MLSPGTEPNEHAGWLSVRSRLAVIWKRQFVVVAAHALHFYTSDDRTALKNIVCLAGSTVAAKKLSATTPKVEVASSLAAEVDQESNAEVAVPVECMQTPCPAFVVETLHGKKLHLVAPSPEEAKLWIDVIGRASKMDVVGEGELRTDRDGAVGRLADSIDSWHHLRAGLASRLRSAMASIAAAGSSAMKELQESKGRSGGRAVRPLEEDEPLARGLDTAHGCCEFLQMDAKNAHVLDHASAMVTQFNRTYEMGLQAVPGDEIYQKVEVWREAIGQMQDTLVQLLLASNPSLQSCLVIDSHMSQLSLAAESWIMERVYAKIWGGCTAVCADMDQAMDSTLQQLDQVDSCLLGVRREHREAIVGDALACFCSLNSSHSPLDKALVLQRTSRCMLDTIKRVTSSYSQVPEADRDGFLPCADDLLSLYICLMAHAKVRHLASNACYIDHFLHINSHDFHPGELGYHLTTFLAACEYVRSHDIQSILSMAASEERVVNTRVHEEKQGKEKQGKRRAPRAVPSPLSTLDVITGLPQTRSPTWDGAKSRMDRIRGSWSFGSPTEALPSLSRWVPVPVPVPASMGKRELDLVSLSQDIGQAYLRNITSLDSQDHASKTFSIPPKWMSFAHVVVWGREATKRQAT